MLFSRVVAPACIPSNSVGGFPFSATHQHLLLPEWLTLAILTGVRWQPLWKTVWSFLKKSKIELPYDPAITLRSIYPKDTNVAIQRGTCTPMSIAAMSTIAKLQKELNCRLTDEWIKKMWSIYYGPSKMKYYAAIKNEILLFATTWMELRGYYAK